MKLFNQVDGLQPEFQRHLARQNAFKMSTIDSNRRGWRGGEDGGKDGADKKRDFECHK